MLFTPLCNPKTGESVCGKETRAIVSKFDNLSEDGGGVAILGRKLLVLGSARKRLRPKRLIKNMLIRELICVSRL